MATAETPQRLMLLDTCVYAMLVTASHLVQKGIAGEKICLFIIPVINAAIFLLNYLNHDNVAIKSIHHGEFTAQILVNVLPLSSSAKIGWWIKNGKTLAEKYSRLAKGKRRVKALRESQRRFPNRTHV
ncbi:DUF943 family protein [Cronobacter dublinensis]